MGDKFGMMDNAYFTSKSEIIKWINETLKLNITKIEQACTGAIYCQLLDSIFINKVNMNKVNWKAKNENEFLQNLKILQQSFIEFNINKYIDIWKIAKGKFQENFEVLQWFKGFYDNKNPDNTLYDPEKRRNYQNLTYLNNNYNTSIKKNIRKEKKLIKNQFFNKTNYKNWRSLSKKELSSNKLNMIIGNIEFPVKFINPHSTSKNLKKNNEFLSNNNDLTQFKYIENIINSDFTFIEEEKNKEIQEIRKNYEEKIKILNQKNSQNEKETKTLKIILAEVGKEKEFYYNKLRDIEFLLNTYTSCDKTSLIEFMKSILYSKKETIVEIDNDGIPKLKYSPFI